MKKLFTIAAAVILLSLQSVYSQGWPVTTGSNLILGTSGSADFAVPKTAGLSNGTMYASWFDNRSSSYGVYLQYLNEAGIPAFTQNGLLISGTNPQNSSLVDHDLYADADGAVLAFTDTRGAGDLNVHVYKISPSGNFDWGANGVTLSSSTDFEADPRITRTTDGNYVFAWPIMGTVQRVGLQKLSPAGAKLWGANPVEYASGTSEKYTYPRIVASDSGGVIVVHTGATGNFPAQTVKIYAQKFNSNGQPQWGAGGISIQNLGKIAAFQKPTVISDGAGGAIVSWYDDRNNLSIQGSYVQHIRANGTLAFAANGASVSTDNTMHQFYPSSAYILSTDEVVVFWNQKDALQNQASIYGQKLSASGDKLWGSTGKVFIPLSSTAITTHQAYGYDTPGSKSATCVYLAGSGINSAVNAFRSDMSGNSTLNPPHSYPNLALTNGDTEKMRAEGFLDAVGNLRVIWDDVNSIQGKAVTPSGTLGFQAVPVELRNFSAAVSGNDVTLEWSTATETNNSHFEVERTGDNGRAVKAGSVNGKGTTTELSIYRFEDKNLNTGKYTYRLYQIDYDGTRRLAATTETEILNVPQNFTLEQNYPNPFNGETVIRFAVPYDSDVQISVYDTKGELKGEIFKGNVAAGNHSLRFDTAGLELSSGVYFYRLSSGNFSQIRKLVLMK